MKSSESYRIDINFGHVTSPIVQDGEFPSCVGRYGAITNRPGPGKRDDRDEKKKRAMQLREWSGDMSSSVLLYLIYWDVLLILSNLGDFTPIISSL